MMNRSLPLIAILLGSLGYLPFLLCGLLAMGDNPIRGTQGMIGLIAYGAVILSFLGAVHWGLALTDGAATAPVQRVRYGLGVLPALVGWVALWLTLFAPEWVSLLILLAGFVVTPAVEARGAHLGYVPIRYMGLRWVLSVLVVALLGCVLVVRLVGAHVRYM